MSYQHRLQATLQGPPAPGVPEQRPWPTRSRIYSFGLRAEAHPGEGVDTTRLLEARTPLPYDLPGPTGLLARWLEWSTGMRGRCDGGLPGASSSGFVLAGAGGCQPVAAGCRGWRG